MVIGTTVAGCVFVALIDEILIRLGPVLPCLLMALLLLSVQD